MASPETVVALIARTPRRFDDARLLHLLGRVLVLLRPLHHRGGAIRRITDQKALLHIVPEIAALQIRTRGLRLLRLLETAMVELREFGHQREEPLALPGRRILLLLDLHPALLGELLHGLDESEPVHLLDELDGVP